MPRAAQGIGPRPILAHRSRTRFDPVQNAWCAHFHGAVHARRDGDAHQTAPLGERVWATALRAGRVWVTVLLVEHVWVTVLRVGHV